MPTGPVFWLMLPINTLSSSICGGSLQGNAEALGGVHGELQDQGLDVDLLAFDIELGDDLLDGPIIVRAGIDDQRVGRLVGSNGDRPGGERGCLAAALSGGSGFRLDPGQDFVERGRQGDSIGIFQVEKIDVGVFSRPFPGPAAR